MGDARVQYQLERTLGGLQLAAKHGLFDKGTELRAITHKRRQCEGALVRRQALASDYVRYVEYEEELERLRLLRLARLREDNDIPRQDIARMHSEATHHIVSIFERGVKRCKYDVALWQQYMAWAQRRKMRTAVSRIAARALALFPNNVQLWLTVANHELNGNMSTTTARALLLRALRLNAILHPAQVRAQQEEAAHARPHKRSRKEAGAPQDESPRKPLAVRTANNTLEDTPTLELAPSERELVRLWIEYIRMELVFLERLRRRRAVLNILDDANGQGVGASKTAAEVDAVLREGDDDDDEQGDEDADAVPRATEGEAAPPAVAKLAQGEDHSTTSASDSHDDSLLLGSIAAAALVSAVSLDSSSSLPPRTHFVFLAGVAHLVRCFPFHGHASALRSRLHDDIYGALEARFPHAAPILLHASASPMLDAAYESPLLGAPASVINDEMQQSHALRRASRLSLADSPELRFVCGASDVEGEGDGGIAWQGLPRAAALRSVLQMMDSALHIFARPVQVATSIRQTLDEMRSRVLGLPAPSGTHIAAQLHAARLFKRVAAEDDLRLGGEYAAFLDASIRRTLTDAEQMPQCQDEELLAARLHLAIEQLQAEAGQDGRGAPPQDDNCLHALLAKGLEAAKRGSRRSSSSNMWGLLVAVAAAIRVGADHGVLDAGEAAKAWARLQTSDAGQANAAVWAAYGDWLAHTSVLSASSREAHLKGALARTASEPDAHELLLRRLYEVQVRATSTDATLDWITKHTFARPGFWRWVIEQERAALRARMQTHTHGHDKGIALVTCLFERLVTQHSPSSAPAALVDDTAAYLRFLCVDVAAAVGQPDTPAALRVLQRSVARLEAPAPKVRLETLWQAICAAMRAQQADNDDAVDGGSDGGHDGETETDTEADGASDDDSDG